MFFLVEFAFFLLLLLLWSRFEQYFYTTKNMSTFLVLKNSLETKSVVTVELMDDIVNEFGQRDNLITVQSV